MIRWWCLWWSAVTAAAASVSSSALMLAGSAAAAVPVVVDAARTAVDDGGRGGTDFLHNLNRGGRGVPARDRDNNYRDYDYDLMLQDEIELDEQLIEAVEAFVETAAGTVQREIVNDWNDAVSVVRGVVLWMFPIFDQPVDEIKSDLRKLAFAALLFAAVFAALEPSENRARRRRDKKRDRQQVRSRRRASSWAATDGMFYNRDGDDDGRGGGGGGSSRPMASTSDGGSYDNGAGSSARREHQHEQRHQHEQQLPSSNRERDDDEREPTDFERFERQLWPNISASRYRKLVLPPSCRLVDKADALVAAAAAKQQSTPAPTAGGATATVVSATAPRSSSATRGKRGRGGSATDRGGAAVGGGGSRRGRRADDKNDSGDGGGEDDEEEDDDVKDRHEDNPYQRLRNYVSWVLYLIKSIVSYDYARAGYTLLLWMQGIRQHRTKNIAGGGGVGVNNQQGSTGGRGGDNIVGSNSREGGSDDESDQEDAVAAGKEEEELTTDTTPAPDEDAEGDEAGDDLDSEEGGGEKDVPGATTEIRIVRSSEEDGGGPPTGEPVSPLDLPRDSSFVPVLEELPPPMATELPDRDVRRNVSDGSVYYDLANGPQHDDGEERSRGARTLVGKQSVESDAKSEGRNTPPPRPAITAPATAPRSYKSPFASIHRLSLRRKDHRLRRSNPELATFARRHEGGSPSKQHQQPSPERKKSRALSLSGSSTSRLAVEIDQSSSPPSRSSRRVIDEFDSSWPVTEVEEGDHSRGSLLEEEDEAEAVVGEEVASAEEASNDLDRSRSSQHFFASVQNEPALAQLSKDVSLPDKNGYVLGDEFLTEPRSCTPLLVFVNSRSGPQQGHLLITQLKRLLNPIQVWDLADGGPESILESFLVFTRLRILVCGGDGTVSWIVATIDRMFQTDRLRLQNRKWPPIAILPLGTGNDLARIHGWGGGYNNESLLTILEQISESYISLLDRWEVTIDSGQKNHKKEVKTFFNYLGVGADAQAALQVHYLRESRPDWFFSRLVNKAWYGVFGAEDIIMASCVNVRREIKLIADGVEVQLPPDSQGIILLNIDSYAGGIPLWAHGTTAPPSGNSSVALPPRSSFRRSRSLTALQPSSYHHGMDRIDSSDDLQTILSEEENVARVTACDRPSSCQDGLLDICSIRGAFHLGQIRVGLSNAQRLCQCREAKIIIQNKMAVQIDGEPWRQRPCTVTIRRKKDPAIMLHRSADDSAIETEMSKLLDWAEERRYIDSEVHAVLMKEFSRRIESKTRKRRVRERDNIMHTLKKAISSSAMANNNYNYSMTQGSNSDSWNGSWHEEIMF